MSIFTTEPTRSARDRSVKLVWTLGETVDHNGQPCTSTAELNVIHDRDRKCYIASLQRTNVRDEGGFKVAMFEVFGGTKVRLSSHPTARYSAKGIDAAVDAALTELRSRLEDPMVRAAADPHSPA